MDSLRPTAIELRVSLIFASCLLTYLIHLAMYPERAGRRQDIFGGWLRRGGHDERSATIWNIHLERLTGGGLLSLGMVMTAVALDMPVAASLGLSMDHAGVGLAIGAGAWIVLLPYGYVSARLPQVREAYPEIKIEEWSWGLLAANALTWMGYLIGYEMMFRGLLLLPLVALWGLWPAIAVATTINAMSHLPKGWMEAVGAMALGVGAGLPAALTGSIVCPVMIHVAVAALPGTLVVLSKRQLKPHVRAPCA